MTENGKRRRFLPDAFKLEAVAAVRAGRPVSLVAAELGLPDRLVRGWLRWAEGRATVGSGAASGAPTPPKAQAAPARRVGPSPAPRPQRKRLQPSCGTASRRCRMAPRATRSWRQGRAGGRQCA